MTNEALSFIVFSAGMLVLMGIGMALLLHVEFRGRNWLRGSAMAPYILPTVVVVYLWKWVLDVNHGLISLAVRALGFGTVEWFSTPLSAWLTTIFVSVWH